MSQLRRDSAHLPAPPETAHPRARPRVLLLTIFAAALTLALAACGPGMMGARTVPRPEITPAPTVSPGGSETVSFQRDVLPVLRGRCVVCHGGNGGLWLDSYETIMHGGAGGPAVLPGDPAGSLLLGRITGELQPRMPLNAPPLNDSQTAAIRTWIREGASKN